ncbi:hypothetical protein GCM10010521_63620 [Streptomyces rameus]|uniref:Uncharacterized protein n=1 Tax=Streptomyces rameus TaxID=68261 RepID=A0ABN3V3G4_9ACTN
MVPGGRSALGVQLKVGRMRMPPGYEIPAAFGRSQRSVASSAGGGRENPDNGPRARTPHRDPGPRPACRMPSWRRQTVGTPPAFRTSDSAFLMVTFAK